MSIDGLVGGLIQGLTEFFPISSSGFVVATAILFGLSGIGPEAVVGSHVGSLFALLMRDREVFRPLRLEFGVQQLIKHALVGLTPLFALLMPIVAFGFAEVLEVLEVGWVVGPAFVLMAVALAVGEPREVRVGGCLNRRTAFMIGVAQLVAVVPGLSRSGLTVLAGERLGIERDTALRFSFTIGVPAILAGLGAGFLDDDFSLGASLTVAACVSLLVSLVTVRVAFDIVRARRLRFFSPVCALMGLAVLWNEAFASTPAGVLV